MKEAQGSQEGMKKLCDAGVDADPRFTMTQILQPLPPALQPANIRHSPHTESLRFMHVEYV